MDETFIRTLTLPEWLVKKYFKDKDFYSIDELIGIIEDLDSDVERLEEKVKDLEYDIQENYRPIPYSEMVGISDSDFIEVR